MDGVLCPENPVPGEMCHPGWSKSAIFRDFRQKPRKIDDFMAPGAYIWPGVSILAFYDKMAKMAVFGQFWPLMPLRHWFLVGFSHF